MLAAGKDPASFGAGKSSLAYLQELQAGAGYFLQAPDQEASPVWVTADALVPLSGSHLPISAPPREPKPSKNPSSHGGSEPQGATASPPAGGVPPSTAVPPGSGKSPLEYLEEFEAGESGEAGGSGTPSGGGAEATNPPGGSQGGDFPQGSPAPLPAPAPVPATPLTGEASGEPASESTEGQSSTAGAIVLGLLAGCVIFALGLAVRKGWMRWRYGL